MSSYEPRFRSVNHHCELSLSRITPPDKWCWRVTMPDGHIYSVSKPFSDFEEAVEDMRLSGASALQVADERWRSERPDYAWNNRAGETK